MGMHESDRCDILTGRFGRRRPQPGFSACRSGLPALATPEGARFPGCPWDGEPPRFAWTGARLTSTRSGESQTLKYNVNTLVPTCVILAMAGAAHAQFATTGTGAISVNIPPKAAIRVDTNAPTLKPASPSFAAYAKISTFTYRILPGGQNGSESGSSGISLKITTGFGGAGGASAAGHPAAWDTFSYSCRLTIPGQASARMTGATDCSGGIEPAEAGGTGSVAWVFTSETATDPGEKTGAPTAVVTFTVHSI
jgi:hypothetical protein